MTRKAKRNPNTNPTAEDVADFLRVSSKIDRILEGKSAAYKIDVLIPKIVEEAVIGGFTTRNIMGEFLVYRGWIERTAAAERARAMAAKPRVGRKKS